jgi:hypothetical protein
MPSAAWQHSRTAGTEVDRSARVCGTLCTALLTADYLVAVNCITLFLFYNICEILTFHSVESLVELDSAFTIHAVAVKHLSTEPALFHLSYSTKEIMFPICIF